MIYDITNALSLDCFSEWIQIIRNSAKYDPPLLLVGNKLDLEGDREVSKDQLKLFNENNDIYLTMEISLKTGENVEEMFRNVTSMLLKKY